MRRTEISPRPNWRERCDAVGFTFYDLESEGGRPYWSEAAAYVFEPPEIELLEQATTELFARCMDAVEFVVRQGRFDEFGIPPQFHALVRDSWDDDDPTVYGRFDLAYHDGRARPGDAHRASAPTVTLLEFNADTPTSLVETAAAQWQWLEEQKSRGVLPEGADQFNAVHELLVEQWEHIRSARWGVAPGTRLHLASLRDTGDGELIVEDFDTVAYMAETAKAAGFDPKLVFMEDLAFSIDRGVFLDADDEEVHRIFKLYPWEWMITEQFGAFLPNSRFVTRWVEPPWKLLLSNKQLLVVLWELFPGHPNLLPAFASPDALPDRRAGYVAKPRLGREGANVRVIDGSGSVVAENDGGYGEEGFVFQERARFTPIDGKTAVVGSWVVGETPAGVDLRETGGPITGDLAEFVPHLILPAGTETI
ncbi:glutathionylspermidine synthase family protein [Herbiconiux sp. A18JL235]|uniref:Glutathionylspermidine synthase family protein n=1 Tax=Herbiconiux sp. A18JL235 TaxID=3152363 RepID=A0AB39BIS4_9MICO